MGARLVLTSGLALLILLSLLLLVQGVSLGDPGELYVDGATGAR